MNTWVNNNNKLQKTFEFKTFMQAINWMGKAAEVIDKLNHHPEWTNIYNKVHVTLCTHDAGNIITDKDHELAGMLDNIEA